MKPLHLNLADLEYGQCRFPFGDGPFTFCGCQTYEDSPYCAEHHALTHQPVKLRTDNYFPIRRERAA